MNNIHLYEECFKLKVVDLNEIRIACCGNSVLFVRCEEKWKFGVQFTQGLCRTSGDKKFNSPDKFSADCQYHVSLKPVR
jgi:hypothetical protein